MSFEEWMEVVVHGFEVAGVTILIAGAVIALGGYARDILRGTALEGYERARQGVGRAILLGLEILIVADIVLTITVDATLESAITLGLIVLVRTFLSLSLEVELEGAWPWQRRRRSGE